MASFVTPKKNTAYECYVALVSQANTKIVQVSPTMAAGDVKVSTDNGTSSNITTLPVVGTNTRVLKVNLSAAEMNGDNVTVIFSDAAGAEWCDLVLNIQTSARQIDDLATPTNITAGTLTTVTNLTNLPTIPANWLTAAGTAADFGAEIATAIWTDTTAGDFTVALSVGKSIMNGVALGTGLTINAYTGNTVQTGDSYARIGATGSGLTSLASATNLATVAGYIDTEIGDIQARLPAALVGGRMDSSVGAMAANTLTAAATATDFGTEIATAIWTDTTAGDFTVALSVGKSIMNGVSLGTGLTVARATLVDTLTTYTGNTVQTGDSFARIGATGSSLTSLASATDLATVAGYIDTEVAAIKAKTDNLPAAPAAVGDIPTAIQNADALLNRDMSVGTDSGSPTVRTVRQALRFLRNKFSISGSTLTVTKEDDTTASWTAAVTTDAAAVPITGSDPA